MQVRERCSGEGPGLTESPTYTELMLGFGTWKETAGSAPARTSPPAVEIGSRSETPAFSSRSSVRACTGSAQSIELSSIRDHQDGSEPTPIAGFSKRGLPSLEAWGLYNPVSLFDRTKRDQVGGEQWQGYTCAEWPLGATPADIPERLKEFCSSRGVLRLPDLPAGHWHDM